MSNNKQTKDWLTPTAWGVFAILAALKLANLTTITWWAVFAPLLFLYGLLLTLILLFTVALFIETYQNKNKAKK